MTPYQLRDGNYIHNLDTDDLIKRVNVMWAKVEKPGRVRMVQYFRIKFMTEFEFTCEPPPPIQGCELPPIEAQLLRDIEAARQEWGWRHVFVTPELAASINATEHVRVCLKAA
jgi:hypothetical protein